MNVCKFEFEIVFLCVTSFRFGAAVGRAFWMSVSNGWMACWPSCDTQESSARKTDPKEGCWPLPRRTAQDRNVFKDGMWPGAPRAEMPVAGSPLVLTSTWKGRVAEVAKQFNTLLDIFGRYVECI